MTVISNTVRKNKFFKKTLMQDSNGNSKYVTEIRPVNEDHSFYKIFRMEKHRMLPRGLSGATREIIDFIIIDMNKENLFIFSNEELMTVLGFSIGTVKSAKKTLLENDLIRKSRLYYMFNPSHACVVNGEERIALIQNYNNLSGPSSE